MVVIRVLDPAHFSKSKNRFSRMAFRPSSNGGISVYAEPCALEKSRSNCNHIQAFYSGLTGIPALYWRIDLEWLNAEAKDSEITLSLVQSKSHSGDDCHHDIFGFPKNGTASKNAIEKAWENNRLDFLQCDGQPSRPIDLEMLQKSGGP